MTIIAVTVVAAFYIYLLTLPDQTWKDIQDEEEFSGSIQY